MFHDRVEAGRQLAERLKPLTLADPLVLGIPRGGVVTAAAIAEPLDAEMDVVLARKLRCPQQPELAFGAIGEEGEVYINQSVVKQAHLTSADFEREQAIQIEEIRQRREQIRAVRPAAEIEGRSVILTDDGVALLHSIGRQSPPGCTNPWLRKYIFPGGYSPALSEVLRVIERTALWVTDIEILRLHYARTLRAWRERFTRNRDRIAELYDERFCRMWEFYLTGCEASFRWWDQSVFQMQIARSIDTVPLTRDYMFDWERSHT
jgi:hypothetical protein